jgi:hypothetical protein
MTTIRLPAPLTYEFKWRAPRKINFRDAWRTVDAVAEIRIVEDGRAPVAALLSDPDPRPGNVFRPLPDGSPRAVRVLDGRHHIQWMPLEELERLMSPEGLPPDPTMKDPRWVRFTPGGNPFFSMPYSARLKEVGDPATIEEAIQHSLTRGGQQEAFPGVGKIDDDGGREAKSLLARRCADLFVCDGWVYMRCPEPRLFVGLTHDETPQGGESTRLVVGITCESHPEYLPPDRSNEYRPGEDPHPFWKVQDPVVFYSMHALDKADEAAEAALRLVGRARQYIDSLEGFKTGFDASGVMSRPVRNPPSLGDSERYSSFSVTRDAEQRLAQLDVAYRPTVNLLSPFDFPFEGVSVRLKRTASDLFALLRASIPTARRDAVLAWMALRDRVSGGATMAPVPETMRLIRNLLHVSDGFPRVSVAEYNTSNVTAEPSYGIHPVVRHINSDAVVRGHADRPRSGGFDTYVMFRILAEAVLQWDARRTDWREWHDAPVGLPVLRDGEFRIEPVLDAALLKSLSETHRFAFEETRRSASSGESVLGVLLRPWKRPDDERLRPGEGPKTYPPSHVAVVACSSGGDILWIKGPGGVRPSPKATEICERYAVAVAEANRPDPGVEAAPSAP